MSVKVSICCIAYNQEKYIESAIKGFMLQKTNFDVEIIIADDASSDATARIVSQFVESNPNKIRFFCHKQNIGVMNNFKFALQACKGEYIAICEGDDYWSDPDKLQKQVDFLDINKDFSICYHRVTELYPNGDEKLESLNISTTEEDFTISDLSKRNLIHTPSVVFRNGLIESFPEWFHQSPAGDYVVHLLNARKGKIKYFPEPMAVYRRHDGGLWSALSRADELRKWIKVLNFLLTEGFEHDIIDNLKEQRREIATGLFLILIKEKKFSFEEEMEVMATDATFCKNFILNIYPSLLQSIHNSNSYKLAQKIVNLKKHIVG